MSDIDLPTTLASIRADTQSLARTNSPSWGTVPKIRRVIAGTERLLAAVEAALARHVPAVIEDVQPEPFHYCKTCSGHPAWPCPEVAAITTALAGEEADHA